MTYDLCPAYGDRPAAECHCQICMDPFHGDQKAENDDYEANAPYDYLREAFSDAESVAGMEYEDREYQAEANIAQQDAMEANGGPFYRPVYPDGEIPF